MMTAKKRNELLYALAHNYLLDKKRNKVLMRENDSSYMHSLGMLQGACMVMEYDLREFDNGISIISRNSGRVVLAVMTEAEEK